jgi:ABC-type dipeptide/oligopeptide/nickel transport system ATPase component
MNEPLLSVDDLGIAVDHRELVHRVSLHLARGESLALVGESGSGKSLTARALVSLLPSGLRATGTLHVDGAEVDPTTRAADHRGRQVALLLQDPFTMLNPTMTAGDHIAETLSAAGRPRADVPAEVTRRLAEVGITDPSVAGRYPFELSGGMSQRVALAAALANDPGVLVADEPTTALDVTIQAQIMELLGSLKARFGMSVILITHNFGIVSGFASRVLVMYRGRIVEQGPTDEILRHPKHAYTRALIDCIPRLGSKEKRLKTIDHAAIAAG